MSLNNVKRFIALFFLILFVICSPTIFAQDKNWQQISSSELQSKTSNIEPQTDSEIILGEVLNLDNSEDSSSKHYLRANIFTTRGREQFDNATSIKESAAKTTEVGASIDELNEQDVFKRETAEINESKIKANLFIAPNIFIRNSSRYFRSTGSLKFKSFSFIQKESRFEKGKRIYYSALQTQTANSFHNGEDVPDDNANKSDESFRWRSAIKQSLMFLAIQHGYAFTQAKTRRELKGNFFGDYVKSVKSLHGWADGGRFFTNYIAHPMQGAFTGFIQVQNDPKGLKQRFGTSADYWQSRMKALAWSAAWSTQFEIGPISQASIGNVGLKGKQTYIDIVMTPIGGTAMLISEDALDRFVMERIERRTDNFYVVIFSRMLLSPTRTIANLFRFKTPWYRDRPRF